jgi:hypothetical protein
VAAQLTIQHVGDDTWVLVDDKGNPPKGHRIEGSRGDWLALETAIVRSQQGDGACVFRARLAYVHGKLWNPCMFVPPIEIDRETARRLSCEIGRIFKRLN